MSQASLPKARNNFFLFIKILTFFIFMYLFFKFINQKDLINSLTNISIKEIFFIYFLYLFLPIAMAFRWFVILENFSKIKFIDLLKNIISGFSVSLVFSSALVIDAAKFMRIKKEVGYENALILTSVDKFFALFFKILFLLIFVVFYLHFYEEIEPNVILTLLILTFFYLLIVFRVDKIIIYLLRKFLIKTKYKNIEKIFKKTKKKTIRLIFVNLIIQLINSSIYFLIFLFLDNNLEFIKILIFVPIIELLGQFSFIIFGMKEFSTVFLLSSFNIEKELALAAALIYLFLEYLVIITLYIVLNFNKINFLKKK